MLIPYNEEILLDLNETKQIIKLHIPEGLIELNLNKKSHKPFRFKYFSIYQEFAAMKIGTDGILLELGSYNCTSILDIGTGTGVIALMMAQRNENASIDAIEIDENAIKDASMNFNNSTWSNRLNLINHDVTNIKQQKI